MAALKTHETANLRTELSMYWRLTRQMAWTLRLELKTRPRSPWHVGPLKVGLLAVNTPQNPPEPQAHQTRGPTTRPTAHQIHWTTRPTSPPDNGPIRPTGPTTHRPMMKNSEKLWERVLNFGKQWETIRTDVKLWKNVRNAEIRWETMKNNEKQWETVRNGEKRWEMMRNDKKQISSSSA